MMLLPSGFYSASIVILSWISSTSTGPNIKRAIVYAMINSVCVSVLFSFHLDSIVWSRLYEEHAQYLDVLPLLRLAQVPRGVQRRPRGRCRGGLARRDDLHVPQASKRQDRPRRGSRTQRTVTGAAGSRLQVPVVVSRSEIEREMVVLSVKIMSIVKGCYARCGSATPHLDGSRSHQSDDCVREGAAEACMDHRHTSTSTRRIRYSLKRPDICCRWTTRSPGTLLPDGRQPHLLDHAVWVAVIDLSPAIMLATVSVHQQSAVQTYSGTRMGRSLRSVQSSPRPLNVVLTSSVYCSQNMA